MKKYFLLQLKRAARFLAWGLCVVLVLFGCMSLVYNAMVMAETSADETENSRIQIAVVGTGQSIFLQWGLAAMQFDSTAMSLELVAMDEDEAIDALMRGEIAAYFVFPENFVDDAMYGDVHKLRFVSTVGATGLVSIVKDEIVSIADDILVACENGSYGVGVAVEENGSPETYGKHVNDLALEYVDFLVDRSKMYRIVNVPQNSIPFDRYMLGGLTVLMLMLSALPFAPLYIRSDQSLFRVLRARRVGPVKQAAAEFLAYFAAMTVLLAVVAGVLHLGGLLPEGVTWGKTFASALPVVCMITSLAYCVYALSDHLIGGVLLGFFMTLALSFIGGCMYPLQFFPLSVQRMAALLPTGLARQSLIGCFMGTGPAAVWPLLAYSAAFLAVAMIARACRAGKVRGEAVSKTKRILSWALLLWKRLYKKVTFVLLLVMIPVLVLGYGITAQEESGMLTVALATRGDSPDALTRVFWDDLHGSNLVLFVECTSPEEAEQMVREGTANTAWIFNDHLEESIYDFVAKRTSQNSFITVVEPENRVLLMLLREVLSGKLFPYCTDTLYLQYIRENAPELDHVSDETLLGYYEDAALSDGLFVTTDVEGNAVETSLEDQGYLMTPVRGMLAVVVVLAGLATAMYYIRDEENGTFAWMAQRRKPLMELGCQIISVVNVLVVVLVALAVTGQTVHWGREALLAVLYAACVAAFAMLVRRLAGGIRGLGMVTPLLVVVMLVVCPVFFDLGMMRQLQLLLPPTYFVIAAYNSTYLLYMLAYTAVSLVLCRLIDHFRHAD